MNIVYFDLETQRTANDVGGWDRKTDMGMSIAVTYSSHLNEYRIYSEKRVDDLIYQLLRADLVVGFNVVNFDYQVLMGYTILDLPSQLRTLDLLVEVEEAEGGQAPIKPFFPNGCSLIGSLKTYANYPLYAAGLRDKQQRVLIA